MTRSTPLPWVENVGGKRSELDEGPDMSGARAARQSYRLCKQAALFAQAVLFTIP